MASDGYLVYNIEQDALDKCHADGGLCDVMSFPKYLTEEYSEPIINNNNTKFAILIRRSGPYKCDQFLTEADMTHWQDTLDSSFDPIIE